MPESIPRRRASEPVSELSADLLESGALILEGLLDTASLERLNRELDPFVESAVPDRSFLNPALEWFFGKHTRHVTAVASKAASFATDVLVHPTLLGLCDRILSPACASYQLNLAHVLDRGPGADAQLLHRDELVWVHVPAPHPELQVASVIALVDFTEPNGATRVIPGSHRWDRTRTPEESETVVAEMEAGSAILYLGSTIHGGGANRTDDQWRRGMHLSYVLGWLRTEENHYLATPPEIARNLPRRAQELLGYAAHDALQSGGGYLGALDLRDPVDLMAEGKL